MSNKHYGARQAGQVAHPKVMAANVILGNPRYLDCLQHGICHIDPVNETFVPCGCPNQAMAWVSIGANGHLHLSFLEQTLRPEVLHKFFSNPTFIIQETFVPNDNIGAFFGTNAEVLRILPGEYPMVRHNGRIEVSF
jgi:hypothetical protein